MAKPYRKNTDPEGELMPPEKLSTDPMAADFFQLLAAEADSPDQKANLVLSILRGVREGDATAYKILQQALIEGKYTKEEKLKITNEQFRQILLLAAQRLQPPVDSIPQHDNIIENNSASQDGTQGVEPEAQAPAAG